MPSFTLTGRLMRHDAVTPIVGATVLIDPIIDSMPDPIANEIYIGEVILETDVEGEFSTSLVTLDNLYYRVRSGDKSIHIVPATFVAPVAGSTIDLADIVSVVPSPILPADAAAIRAEFAAADSLLEAELRADLGTGGGGALVLNGKDPTYGAVGNGVANDTTAVQAGLTAAANKEIFFPAGTYLISSATTLPACNSLTISGVPGATIFRAHSSKSLTSELIKTTTTGAPVRPIKNLTIRGITFDGASLAPERWLQNPSTGAAITNPQNDYYNASTNPSGKIGNPAFPTYGPNDLVTDNRRNPDYDTQAPMLRLSLCQDTVIKDCVFKNHYGMGIVEAGGLNVTIKDNLFDTIGKNDGPYCAIWCQSYGNPAAPTGTFQDSENTQILNNTFRNLERLAVIFAPTKGGKIVGNTITNVGESGIFVPGSLHYNGGNSVISHNTIKNVNITDISCHGIECEEVFDLKIHDNHIESTDGHAMVLTGLRRCTVSRNTTKNCVRTYTVPYGPFSERYSFNVGLPAIAGESRPLTDFGVFAIGTRLGVGCDRLRIADNMIHENRGAWPAVFQQMKTGTSNAAKSCVIENNRLDVPSGMAFLNKTITGVWDTNIPLVIRGNVGHSSEAIYIDTKQFAVSETGAYTVTCGFRPRVVRIYVAANNATSGQAGIGSLTWLPDATQGVFAEYMSSTSGTGQQFGIFAAQCARLVDAANTVKFSMTFVSWKEDGFTVTVGTCTNITNVRFVCEP